MLLSVFKDNSDNDYVTIVALLLISIMLTLTLAYMSCKIRRTDFLLTLPTKFFLSCKLFVIIYIIVATAIGLHDQMMAYFIDIFLSYIVPLWLTKDLSALCMSGPQPG